MTSMMLSCSKPEIKGTAINAECHDHSCCHPCLLLLQVERCDSMDDCSSSIILKGRPILSLANIGEENDWIVIGTFHGELIFLRKMHEDDSKPFLVQGCILYRIVDENSWRNIVSQQKIQTFCNVGDPSICSIGGSVDDKQRLKNVNSLPSVWKGIIKLLWFWGQHLLILSENCSSVIILCRVSNLLNSDFEKLKSDSECLFSNVECSHALLQLDICNRRVKNCSNEKICTERDNAHESIPIDCIEAANMECDLNFLILVTVYRDGLLCVTSLFPQCANQHKETSTMYRDSWESKTSSPFFRFGEVAMRKIKVCLDGLQQKNYPCASLNLSSCSENAQSLSAALREFSFEIAVGKGMNVHVWQCIAKYVDESCNIEFSLELQHVLSTSPSSLVTDVCLVSTTFHEVKLCAGSTSGTIFFWGTKVQSSKESNAGSKIHQWKLIQMEHYSSAISHISVFSYPCTETIFNANVKGITSDWAIVCGGIDGVLRIYSSIKNPSFCLKLNCISNNRPSRVLNMYSTCKLKGSCQILQITRRSKADKPMIRAATSYGEIVDWYACDLLESGDLKKDEISINGSHNSSAFTTKDLFIGGGSKADDDEKSNKSSPKLEPDDISSSSFEIKPRQHIPTTMNANFCLDNNLGLCIYSDDSLCPRRAISALKPRAHPGIDAMDKSMDTFCTSSKTYTLPTSTFDDDISALTTSSSLNVSQELKSDFSESHLEREDEHPRHPLSIPILRSSLDQDSFVIKKNKCNDESMCKRVHIGGRENESIIPEKASRVVYENLPRIREVESFPRRGDAIRRPRISKREKQAQPAFNPKFDYISELEIQIDREVEFPFTSDDLLLMEEHT